MQMQTLYNIKKVRYHKIKQTENKYNKKQYYVRFALKKKKKQKKDGSK